MLKGIDVSSHQGKVNWSVLQPQVDFVILRSSHGMESRDEQFERNYAECKRLGIPIGVYHYFYYADADRHALELNNFLSSISGKSFEYPAFIDYEEYKLLNNATLGWLPKDKLTDYALADMLELKSKGFVAGIYANKNWLTNKLVASRIPADCWVWLAQYNPTITYAGRVDMWQYTSAGELDGFVGRLDMNKCYRDIKKKDEYPMLKVGSKGEQVARVQQILKNRAYSITVDGDFGEKTKQVVIAFQKDHNLEPDGIVGEKTWARLDSIRTYSLALDGEKWISKNFQVKEFKCNDGSDAIKICMNNLKNLQNYRDMIGRPVHINSAYRTPAYNSMVGGEQNSLHMFGYAVDFFVDGYSPAEVYNTLDKTHKGGLGKYRGFTHMDDGRNRRWDSSK